MSDNTIWLADGDNDELDRTTTQQVCSELVTKAGTHRKLWLTINTNGGSVTHGLAITDTIRRIQPRVHVTGVVVGACMSAGVWVLQACDYREAGQDAQFMVHAPTYGVSDVQLESLETHARSCRQERDRLYRALLDQIHTRHPTYSMQALVQWLKTDRYLTAHEALELGLLDHVW